MKYELLKDWFYKDKEKYENLYQQRYINKDSCVPVPLIIENQPAFVVLTPEILLCVENIYKTNIKVGRIVNYAPPVMLFAYTKQSIVDEIMMTNQIEGIHSTRKEITLALDEKASKKKNRLFGQAKKYQKINERNIVLDSSEDIRKLYDEMYLPEIEKKDCPDGKIFRKETVAVTDGIKNLHSGVFPEEEIIKTMNAMLAWLKDDEIADLLKIAVFHYAFGFIHPFYDGNGRLSRFLSSHMLAKSTHLYSALNLSSAILSKKTEYYKAFEICNDYRNKGDLTPFVITFLGFVLSASKMSLEKLKESNNKWAHYAKYVSKMGYTEAEENAMLVCIQKALFDSELITYTWLAKTQKIATQTATKFIEKFIADGYMKIEKNGRPILFAVDFDFIDNKFA